MTMIFRRKRRLFASLLLIFSLMLAPLGTHFDSQAARATGTVKNPILNVRASASTSSAIICKLTQGTKVTIIGETTGDDGMKWYDVFFAYNGDAKEGYVRADLLNVAGSVPAASSGNTGTSSAASGSRYVKPPVALVRSIASTSGDIRSRLEKGSSVTILSSQTGADGMTWYKVSFTKNGSAMEGYMRGDLLTDTNPGGTSSGSNGADVSGTRYVNTAVARVRTIASTTGDIRSRLSSGTQVSLISSKKGDDGMTWYKVAYTDGGYQLNGYIRSDLLSDSRPGGSGSSSSGSSTSTPASIKPAVANIRSIASTTGDIRSKLSQGTGVTIIGEKNGTDGMKWYKISYTHNGNALEGYIRSDLLNVGIAGTSSGSSGSSNSGSSSGSSNSTAVAQVRSIASPYGDIRATLQNGTKVTILKEKIGEDGQKWTKIAFTQNGERLEGYVPSSILK